MQSSQLENVTLEYETGEWEFELMIDREAFTSIPNSGIGDRREELPRHCDGEETSLFEVWRDWSLRPFLSREEGL